MALLVYVLFSTKLMQNCSCFISISLGFMNRYSFQLEYHQRLSYNFCLLFFVCFFSSLRGSTIFCRLLSKSTFKRRGEERFREEGETGKRDREEGERKQRKMGDRRTSIKREDGECSLKKCEMIFKA